MGLNKKGGPIVNNQKGVTLIELLAVIALSTLLLGVLFGINQMIQTGFQDTSKRYQDDAQVRKVSEMLTNHLAEPTELTLSTNQLRYKIYDHSDLPSTIEKRLFLEEGKLFLSELDGTNRITVASDINKMSFIVNNVEYESLGTPYVMTSGLIQMKIVFQYEGMEKSFLYPIKILKDK